MTTQVTQYRFNIMANRIYFITRSSTGKFSFFLSREGLNTETWYKFLLPGSIYTSFISFFLLNRSNYKLVISQNKRLSAVMVSLESITKTTNTR